MNVVAQVLLCFGLFPSMALMVDAFLPGTATKRLPVRLTRFETPDMKRTTNYYYFTKTSHRVVVVSAAAATSTTAGAAATAATTTAITTSIPCWISIAKSLLTIQSKSALFGTLFVACHAQIFWAHALMEKQYYAACIAFVLMILSSLKIAFGPPVACFGVLLYALGLQVWAQMVNTDGRGGRPLPRVVTNVSATILFVMSLGVMRILPELSTFDDWQQKWMLLPIFKFLVVKLLPLAFVGGVVIFVRSRFD